MRRFHCMTDPRDTLEIGEFFSSQNDLEMVTRGRSNTHVMYLSVEDVKQLHNHLADVLDRYHETTEGKSGILQEQSGRENE